MDVKKFLDELSCFEWGDGSDFVAKGLEKLMEASSLDEKELAYYIFEIYFADRSNTWDRAQEYLKAKINQI